MRKALTVVAAVAVLVIILVGVLTHINRIHEPETPAPEGPQTGACTLVKVISAPGTWESAADDDPYNPQANPASFMLNISRPLQQAFAGQPVEVWTLPYVAEFRNVNGGTRQATYDDSRNQGINRVFAEMRSTLHRCPNAQFVLTGFSQGAVIMGDIASEVGNGRTEFDPQSVLGVALISDGRRVPGEALTPMGATELPGVGAEVALHPLNALVQAVVPGATMRGVRDGGFGSLADRTYQICAPDDTICDAPPSVTDALARAEALVDANGVHALYASNPAVIPGTTADQWTVQWASGVIEGALR